MLSRCLPSRAAHSRSLELKFAKTAASISSEIAFVWTILKLSKCVVLSHTLWILDNPTKRNRKNSGGLLRSHYRSPRFSPKNFLYRLQRSSGCVGCKPILLRPGTSIEFLKPCSEKIVIRRSSSFTKKKKWTNNFACRLCAPHRDFGTMYWLVTFFFRILIVPIAAVLFVYAPF